MIRVAIAGLAVLFAATAAHGATPKPYMWTTAQAAQAVRVGTQLVYTTEYGLPMTLTRISCRGVGRAVQRRFLAFRCPAVYRREGTAIRPGEEKRVVVSVKMRQVGRGSICAAVGAVPAGCLARGPRVPGTMSEAYAAYRRETQSAPSDDECYQHGSGFYSCWWVDSTGRHTATITFSPDPIVRVLS